MRRAECKTCLVAVAVLGKFRIDEERTDDICPKRCSKKVLKDSSRSQLLLPITKEINE